MTQWVDVTSYSHSEVDRVPRSWELACGRLSILVHRMYGDSSCWYLSCPMLCIDGATLQATELEEAKREATGTVEAMLRSMAHSLSTASAGER